MRPFFSVIITTYNRAAILGKAIESVFAQTYIDFELIVVDDCSTDDTLDRLASYKGKLRLFTTKKNCGGPATPRNRGIQEATGEWICFCDSDDEYRPDHLEKLHAFISEKNLTDGIISTNAMIMHNGKKSANYYFSDSYDMKTISLQRNWKSNHAILSSICIRNDAIVRFREGKQYHSIEDYIFLLENMLNGKRHYYLGHAGIYYNEHSDDSLRFVHLANGLRLYRYKLDLWKQYRLWQSTSGIPLLIITGLDFLKYRIKKRFG